MDKDTANLGQLILLYDGVDRRVVVMLLRAMLTDATPEKIQALRDLMALLREQLEMAVDQAEDEEAQGHARIVLMRFDKWDIDIDHMLHEKTKPNH